jgi:L,D-peptidoglycan transpeptidase YkuD (ErfK/YbiS/YcfS/YnhG family)
MSFLPAYSSKRNPKILITLGFLLSLILPGCSPPSLPPEVGLAERMNHDLWKAQAHIYAPEDYQSYKITLKNIMDDLIREEARFIWFRDYEPIAERLKAVLRDGEGILEKVQERKEAKRVNIVRQLSDLEDRLTSLDRVSLTINEGRLARRNLIKAALMMKEADLFLDREDYEGATSRLTMASGYIKASEEILVPIFNRYTDKTFIEKWRRWVDEATAESREKGTPAIVVSKIDRRLTIYKRGKPFKTYEIGIGRNGLSDKLLAGDGATPEGSYRVIKKLSRSRYRKALLLDYPNDEDRKEFLRLKKMGLIPKKAGMGGLIEIHGGGKEGMTYGCVSLENRHMDEVFESVPLGTPVAIVGTTSLKDDIPITPKKVEDD